MGRQIGRPAASRYFGRWLSLLRTGWGRQAWKQKGKINRSVCRYAWRCRFALEWASSRIMYVGSERDCSEQLLWMER